MGVVGGVGGCGNNSSFLFSEVAPLYAFKMGVFLPPFISISMQISLFACFALAQ